MSALTVTPITATGITPTFVAASNTSQTVPCGNRTFIAVRNASGSSVTVTVVSTATVSGLAVADVSVSVPATTGERWIGPFPTATFDNGSTEAAISYSALTSVTVAAFSI